MRRKLLLTVVTLGALVLSGCFGGNKSNKSSNNNGSSSNSSTSSKIDAPALNGQKIADFAQGEAEEIFGSDGWSNGQPFNAVWKEENITYSNGQMHLGIKAEEAVDGDETYPYTAGEARTHHLYGYGDFEVRMRPTNVVGSVSTFFTYTGEYDEIDGVKNQHHEIDIEFLGKDTTKVQFNYFVNGVGEHEHMHDLGFDASKDFHNYGFRWAQDAITWFVDGVAVYQVKASADNPLPSQAGRIMTSYWPSSADGWSGHFAGATNDTVDYEWIKCSGEASYADADKPAEPVDDGIKWNEITPVQLSFAGSDNFTITNNGTSSVITYSQSGNYAAVSCGTLVDQINANNVVNVTLKNGSNSKSAVRVDIQGTNKISTGDSGSESDCLNTSAYAEGHSEIYTDMLWGGTKIELAANEEVELVIIYDVTTEEKGAGRNLLVFPDSLQGSMVAHEGGSITVSNVRFANNTGSPITPYVPGPVDPVDPSEPSMWDDIAETDVTFVAQRDDLYTVSKTEGVTTVTYSQAGDWGTIAAGDAQLLGIINSNNKINLTLKNNSASASNIRVDIQGTKKVGNSDCLNTAAEARGHTEVRTDATWGGSFITLAASEEAEFIVTYDVTTETKYGAISLLVFIDSMQSGNVAHEGGNISISKIKFANTTGGNIAPHEVPVDPVDPVDPQPSEGLALAFTGNEEYVLSTAEATKSIDVTYAGVGGSSYKNIMANVAASDLEGKSTFSITIKNNAETASEIRVDVLGQTKVENTNCLNVSAVAENHPELYTDTTWGGTKLTVAAGETVTLVITFDQTTEKGLATGIMLFIDSAHNDAETYAGNVSFSNFVFGGEAEEEGLALEFSGNEEYVLGASGAQKSVNVTYSGIGGSSYKNIMANVNADDVLGKTTFSITIKNNAETASEIRIDVLGQTKVENTNCLNVSASAENHPEMYTDTTWGGTKLTVAAGETVTVVITFDQTTEKGLATGIMLFIDSAHNDSETYAGNVTFSGFAFGGEAAPVDNSAALLFSNETAYTLDPVNAETKSVTASYTDMAGNSYANFGAGLSTELVEHKTEFSVTIKNNGEADVVVRVDIKGENTVGNTDALNDGGKAEGHSEIYTDTEWGGTKLTVAAGETVTLKITFSQSTERGHATYLMFFVDSSIGDETLRSGNVTFSNFIFA